MKKFTLAFIVLFSFMFLKMESVTAACIWKSKISNFYTWDSCSSTKASLNGYLSLNSKGCFIYQWKVNNSNVGTNNPVINYRITQNGTYTLCVKVTDTCNNCDTTLCASFTITCFNKCNWKGRAPSFTVKDTCKGSGGVNSITANISFNNTSCLKYFWTVNGVTQSSKNPTLNYKVTANGTYNVCVKVMDTCKKCDTTICSSRTFTCFTSKCVWKPKTSTHFWDTCKGTGGRNSLNAYVSMKSGSCYKYQWMVNNSYAGNGTILHYNIYSNGTYNVCVKVMDTCNKCDTMICYSKTITCFGTSTKCNWKNNISSFHVWDTCKGSGSRNSLNGSITFKTGGCYKYLWKVNSTYVSTANGMHYVINSNGTYTICVKLMDTCNNCDTVLCVTKTISCFGSSTKCNWKGKISNFHVWDTCKGSGYRNSLNGYIAFKTGGCYKYQWKVNGAYAGNDYVMKYVINSNGTYTICVKVMDTCNNCDTMLCATKTISCFGSSSKCNWKGKISNFHVWDTCKGAGARNSINGYIAFKTGGCYKYLWKVNNATAGTGSIMHYKITANGTYNVCVKIIDTCNNCDTTLCATKTLNCFSKPCNFKARGPSLITWDSCIGSNAAILGYISFNNSKCLKYAWTVAGMPVGTGPYLVAPIYKNGTYTICVKVIDTCNSSKCDTSICVSRTIKCNGLGMDGSAYLMNSINVYPNPVNDILNIEFTGDKVQAEVSTMLGELVYSGELSGDKKSIRTEGWSNGIYMVRINTDTGSKIFKIVVNR